MHNDDDDNWDRPWTLAEMISAAVILAPFFAFLGLAWWALMWPVLH